MSDIRYSFTRSGFNKKHLQEELCFVNSGSHSNKKRMWLELMNTTFLSKESKLSDECCWTDGITAAEIQCVSFRKWAITVQAIMSMIVLPGLYQPFHLLVWANSIPACISEFPTDVIVDCVWWLRKLLQYMLSLIGWTVCCCFIWATVHNEFEWISLYQSPWPSEVIERKWKPERSMYWMCLAGLLWCFKDKGARRQWKWVAEALHLESTAN